MNEAPPANSQAFLSRAWPFLAALAFVPYLLALRHGFYEDDFWYLEKAFLVGSHPLRAFVPWKDGEVRPVGVSFFYLQYLLFGFRPFGYNLVSLLLHIGSALLVARMAILSGVGRGASIAAGILFFAGMGHCGKPIEWACTQPMALATFLALASTVLLLSGRRRVVLPIAAAIAAMLAHEIALLAPLGFALISLLARHPRRRVLAASGIAATILFSILTLPEHMKHPVHEITAGRYLRNLVNYAGSYIVAPQSVTVALQHVPLVPAASAGFLIAAIPFLIGVAVLAGLAAIAARARGAQLGILVLGALVLAPALAMPMPPHWVETRHLYTASAFLLPAVCAAVAAIPGRFPSWRPLLTAMGLLFFLGVVSGSLYMTRRVYQEASKPDVQQRWERLNEVRAGLPPQLWRE